MIDDLRQGIDATDAEIQKLLNKRAELAKQIGETKAPGDAYRPGREAEVLRAARERNQGPLTDEQMAHIMREIMSACLRLESPLDVAYLGPAGSYTEDALHRFFGKQVTAASERSIEAVFHAVESGRTSYGVVPVENSTHGVVSNTLDLMVNAHVQICGEVTVPVHHNLLCNGDVSVIRAHPQSFGQCQHWLEANFPDTPREEVSSNSEAARLAAEQGGAAIAGLAASRMYGLDVMHERIEDDPRNRTRFVIIGQNEPAPSGQDKTSIVMAANDRPGALMDLLEPFASAGINLTRIQSRPSHKDLWRDLFFVDLDGHASSPEIAEVLEKVKAAAAFYRVLGSYPAPVI